jgi:hypothetical protein
MIVTAIKIDEYNGYIIHGFPRAGTGKHNNNYVKISRNGVLGKYMFDVNKWDGICSLNRSTKKIIEDYLIENKITLQHKIKELG